MKNKILGISAVAMLVVGVVSMIELSTDANLSGQDVDQNGLRDDVDAFIESQAYSSNEDAAVRLMAKAVSGTLQGGFKTQERIDEINKDITSAFACMTVHLGSDRALIASEKLGTLILNAPERKRAYSKIRELGRIPDAHGFLPDGRCPMLSAI